MTTLQIYDDPMVDSLTDLDDPDAILALDSLSDNYETLENARRRLAVEGDLLKLGKALKALDLTDGALETHALAIAHRRQSIANRREYLKGWMLNLCLQMGIERVKDPLVTVYTQRNNPSVEVLDEAAVPVEYKRATLVMPLADVPAELRDKADVQVLKQQILEDAKQGVIVDGVHIERESRHLRVR